MRQYYNYGTGERLTTQYPIIVNGKPTYFVQVVTPTSQIYSMVNNVLSVQQVKMFSLFATASYSRDCRSCNFTQKVEYYPKKRSKKKNQGTGRVL